MIFLPHRSKNSCKSQTKVYKKLHKSLQIIEQSLLQNYGGMSWKNGFSHMRCRQWKGKFKGLRPVFAIFHAVRLISGNSDPNSARFAGFRTCVTGARCPDARKRWKGEGYIM